MCKDKIFIPSILQSYVLHWCHTYLLRLEMDRTEAIVSKQFFWTGITNAVRREVTNCDTCQHTKLSMKKNGKLSVKESEEITRKKLCLDIIG